MGSCGCAMTAAGIEDLAGLWDRVEQRAIAEDEAVAVLEALAGWAQKEGALAFDVCPSRLFRRRR